MFEYPKKNWELEVAATGDTHGNQRVKYPARRAAGVRETIKPLKGTTVMTLYNCYTVLLASCVRVRVLRNC